MPVMADHSTIPPSRSKKSASSTSLLMVTQKGNALDWLSTAAMETKTLTQTLVRKTQTLAKVASTAGGITSS